jgi:hypothetical protein
MKAKPTKDYTIYSANPKMDTSGMAGKPAPMEMYTMEFKMPPMNLNEMMRVKAEKEEKRRG